MSKPKNRWESQVYDTLTDANAIVYHNGSPDIMAQIAGLTIAVEVKASPTYELSPEQQEMMGLFHSLGIKCYRWNPREGFIALFQDSPDMNNIIRENIPKPILDLLNIKYISK